VPYELLGSLGWLNEGKQLVYVTRRPDLTLRVMVVDVVDGSGFQWGPPRSLLDLPAGVAFADITRDGKRILAGISTEGANVSAPINVVLNWTAGLED
jgi:hypothetical protein